MKYSLSLIVSILFLPAIAGCMYGVSTDEPAPKTRELIHPESPGPEQEPVTAETQKVIVELEKDLRESRHKPLEAKP